MMLGLSFEYEMGRDIIIYHIYHLTSFKEAVGIYKDSLILKFQLFQRLVCMLCMLIMCVSLPHGLRTLLK